MERAGHAVQSLAARPALDALMPRLARRDRVAPQAGLFAFGEEPALAGVAELVVERLQTYLEEFGGAGLVVLGLLQRPHDHLALDLFDGRADGERDGVLL